MKIILGRGGSHLDHNLTMGQLAYIKEKYADRSSFFRETIELPEELGTVPVNLVGPATGEVEVEEDDVEYVVREGRKWASRMLLPPTARPQSRVVTVIAGPHNGENCVLYTAYGGPLAPREPGDPNIMSWEELLEARLFWAKHALIPDKK